MRTSDFKLSDEVQRILGAIRSLEARPLLVGGCVRDTYMGRRSADVDIEVHNLHDMDVLVETLRKVARVDAVGQSFGVLKCGEGGKVDVSLPRRDSKTDKGHTGFSITVDPNMTVEEASARRDFTMNSMMFDPFTETLLDPHKGRADIELRRIRHTTEAFSEDPLRVLRAVQFSGRFGFWLDRETAALCRGLKDTYQELAPERVWGEWEKLLKKGVDFVVAFDTLRKTGWAKFFPELKSVVGGDALALAAECDRLKIPSARRAILILASLTLTSRSKIVESIGAPKGLSISAAKLATEAHDVKTMYATDSDVRHLARRLVPFGIDDVCMIMPYGAKTLASKARRAGVLYSPIKLPLNGEDLIEAGYKPGPLFTEILKAVREEVDNSGGIERPLDWVQQRFPQ